MVISWVEILIQHLYIYFDFSLTYKMTYKGNVGDSPYVQDHYVSYVTENLDKVLRYFVNKTYSC